MILDKDIGEDLDPESVAEKRWRQYLNHVLQELDHNLGEHGENGWYSLSDEPHTCCKIRKGGKSIDAKVTSGNKHLIPEYTKQTTDGTQIVFAPNYIGMPNLGDIFDQLTLEERLKILKDAMDGCNHLHTQNFIHGDINSSNIIVKTDDDGKMGLLGDLECMVREGDKQTGGFGTYHESTYYGNFSVSKNADRRIDSFSFGLLLLACYIGLSRITEIEQYLAEKDVSETRSMRFNKWLEIKCTTSNIPKQIQEIIKHLLSPKRDNRPNLPEVIAIL